MEEQTSEGEKLDRGDDFLRTLLYAIYMDAEWMGCFCKEMQSPCGWLGKVGAVEGVQRANRNEIKNGTILRLTTSPAQNAQQLHERIQSSSIDAKLEALKDLASLSRDLTFAQEFINLDGISLLTQMVDSGTDQYQKLQKIMKPCFGDMLSFTLMAFEELMDHGIVSWDTFSVAFIKKIASFVNKSAMDISILQWSLAILESMVLNSHDLYQKVAQEITIGQLIPHLQGTDQEIQTYTITVINALFLKAADERRQEMANILAQKQLRSIILTHVIRAQRAINNEMAHQLYVLQVLTFNLLEDRMMTKMDPQDQAQRDIIFELRRIAFDAETEPNNSSSSVEKRKSMYTRDYKKLGFINHVNPAMDFTQTPPGMLALDNMLYFAKHHQDAYIRLIPFYKLSSCVAELCAIASSMSNFTSKIEVQTYKGLAVVRLQLAACPHSTCDCPQLAQWKKGSLASFLHLVASLA
ncbi:LOW QUALITY PROTEIN: engulfment and cell motility protein 1-like [Dipodomys spectabilis]|uniref:LOW QUALITY PROTEIN: engulfment and cell motility protein 1-like n=1 Tax=Dipodomys spectabilis TaxID=105255 RepID=UPI001C54036F|nr:LOW QUALITY PROTEIN: engulfment and cell motility protein 1-like [Dipodomys spectabilis]